MTKEGMSKLKLEAEKFLVRLFRGPSKYERVIDQDADHHDNKHFYIFSFQNIARITLSLPLSGFIFCVIYSILHNFSDATSTHCGVDNYLPSVSASIGAFSPQKYVWRATIALHSAPRYIVALTYRKCLNGSHALLLCSYFEITALLGLSVVSSSEKFVIHAFCFLVFIVTSFIGMLIHLNHNQLWSVPKLRFFVVNTLSWVMALFFYERHNKYCETGVYSMFAACEYTFVISNMLFHFQAYYDFKTLHLSASHSLHNESKFAV